MEVIKGKKKVLLVEVDVGENTVTVSGSPYPSEELEKLPLKDKGFAYDSWTEGWFISYPPAWKGRDLVEDLAKPIYEILKSHSEAVAVLMKRGLYSDIVEVWSKT